jgi:hypothetical protein
MVFSRRLAEDECEPGERVDQVEKWKSGKVEK